MESCTHAPIVQRPIEQVAETAIGEDALDEVFAQARLVGQPALSLDRQMRERRSSNVAREQAAMPCRAVQTGRSWYTFTDVIPQLGEIFFSMSNRFSAASCLMPSSKTRVDPPARGRFR